MYCVIFFMEMEFSKLLHMKKRKLGKIRVSDRIWTHGPPWLVRCSNHLATVSECICWKMPLCDSAVSEFACACHYLAVYPHDAVPVEAHILTLLTIESPVAQWFEHPTRSRSVVGFKSHLHSDFSTSAFLPCICIWYHAVPLNCF